MTLIWGVGAVPDGTYELQLVSNCSATGVISYPNGLDQSYSSILTVLIDRAAPRDFTQHIRPLGSYLPNDDISVPFNEPIDCASVSVKGMSSTNATLSKDSFVVMCSGNTLFLDFAPTLSPSVRCRC